MVTVDRNDLSAWANGRVDRIFSPEAVSEFRDFVHDTGILLNFDRDALMLDVNAFLASFIAKWNEHFMDRPIEMNEMLRTTFTYAGDVVGALIETTIRMYFPNLQGADVEEVRQELITAGIVSIYCNVLGYNTKIGGGDGPVNRGQTPMDDL